MDKLDFKKSDRQFYRAETGTWALVDVPEWQFLMIDGAGDPNVSTDYAQAVGALYMLSYGLKFRSKAVYGRDYVVGPLEGLWWADDMDAFVRREKGKWKWRMMIRQPEWLTGDDVEFVRQKSLAKVAKAQDEAMDAGALASVRFSTFHEGLSAQSMHRGSYDDEGPALAELHRSFIPANGLIENGPHHEIYFNDPRKVEAAKLTTLLRQPVRAGS